MLAENSWTFEATMDNVAKAFEVVGVVIIVVGALYAMVFSLREFHHLNKFFADVRREFGRPLVLGLEILVAVRIALSFSLDIEIDGVVPWRRKETAARLEALQRGVPPDDDG